MTTVRKKRQNAGGRTLKLNFNKIKLSKIETVLRGKKKYAH